MFQRQAIGCVHMMPSPKKLEARARPQGQCRGHRLLCTRTTILLRSSIRIYMYIPTRIMRCDGEQSTQLLALSCQYRVHTYLPKRRVSKQSERHGRHGTMQSGRNGQQAMWRSISAMSLKLWREGLVPIGNIVTPPQLSGGFLVPPQLICREV